MAGKKLVGINGLTVFPGSIDAEGLNIYVVDENDVTLDGEGSGYRLLIHENLVVTDGSNPVQVTGGGTIDLGGNDVSISPGTGGDLVTTSGEQVITNKTFPIVQGEVGPILHIRTGDFWIYRSDTAPNNGRMRFGAGLLDNTVDHLFHFPNNTASGGISTVVDDETTQTVKNKTLDRTNVVTLWDDNFSIAEEYAGGTKVVRFEIDAPDFPDGISSILIRNAGSGGWLGRIGDTLHIRDTSLIIYDASVDTGNINTGGRAVFELDNSITDLVTFTLPYPGSAAGTLVTTAAAQTLLNKNIQFPDAIHILDSQLVLYDTSQTINVGRRARFELLGSDTDLVTYYLPYGSGETTQTIVTREAVGGIMDGETIIEPNVHVADSEFVIYSAPGFTPSSGSRALFQVAATGSLQTYNLPAIDGSADTVALLGTAQTLESKSLEDTRELSFDRVATQLNSSGAFTASAPFHCLYSNSGASDNLDTINGGQDGQMLILSAVNGHTITVRQVGNIVLRTTGLTATLSPSLAALFVYRSDLAKWMHVGYGV